jgi:hypothetical protein
MPGGSIEMSSSAFPADARCLGCAYLLRGLADHRCPECGRAFDPGDPRTMYVGLPMGPWAMRLFRPTGRSTAALGCVAAAAILWGEAWLAGGVYVSLIGQALGLTYVGYRWLRATVRVGLSRRYRRPLQLERWPLPSLVLAAAILLCVLEVLDFPRRAVLWAHRPLLDRFVRRVHTQMPLFEAEKQTHPRMIGLMYVHDARIYPSGVSLLVGPYGWIDYRYSEADDAYWVQITIADMSYRRLRRIDFARPRGH